MKQIERILVVGAGVMGHGIALVCARSGIAADLVDTDENYLESALSRIKKFLAGSVERKKITPQASEEILARISTTTNIESVAGGADLVMEAIIEDKGAKANLFKQLNTLCDPSVIFASNTSQISITELARVSGRPDRFIGLHWFNPPAIMTLIEIPKGIETSEETVETVVSLAKRLGKEPVVCKDSPGFVVNRILNVWYNEGMRLLDEGAASVAEIDGAIREGGGFRMGPMQLRDLVGLDTALLITESLYQAMGNEKFRPCQCLRDLVAAGHLGRKTGKGFYEYGNE
jgi:3-hydroxybutyryl-CoA dehydrogenase